MSSVNSVLVGVGGRHSLRTHPLLDAGSFGPAACVHLVSSQVEKVIIEQSVARYLVDEGLDQVERVLVRRIDRLGTLDRWTHFRVYSLFPRESRTNCAPRLHVAGDINFWNDANTPDTCILQNLPQFVLCVAFEGSIAGVPEPRERLGLNDHRLVVGEMPVHGIELGIGERVDDLLQHSNGEEVAHRIHQHSAVLRVRGTSMQYRIARRVVDEPGSSMDLETLARAVKTHQLTERLHGVIRAENRLRMNFRGSTTEGNYESVAFVHAKLGESGKLQQTFNCAL